MLAHGSLSTALRLALSTRLTSMTDSGLVIRVRASRQAVVVIALQAWYRNLVLLRTVTLIRKWRRWPYGLSCASS